MSRTITVKGTGTVVRKADYVTVLMSLEAKDVNYDTMMKLVNQQKEQLDSSIQAVGFKSDDVKTVLFNLETEYENVRNQNDQYQRVFKGYICHHQLKLSFDYDNLLLSKLLNALTQGLTKCELSLDFSVKDVNEVNEALLTQATLDAQKKAMLLCQASQVELGQLLSIDYHWNEQPFCSSTRFALANDSVLTSQAYQMNLEPDDINLHDTATFVWQIN